MSHTTPPAAPEVGAILPASNPSNETLELLARRRSTPIKMLGEPGPPPAALDDMLRLAARVPDHRKIEPWRFIVITGDARVALGEAIAAVRQQEEPDVGADALVEDRARFLRAPACVVIVSSPLINHKTPVWEQELSTGAVCMNLLLAANAMGWSASWISEWCAFSDGVNAVLKLTPEERIAGYMYLGTARTNPPERARPDISTKTTYWSPG